MKKKEIYRAIGLMSGTSMDGVDASMISSVDGKNYIRRPKENRYFEYDKDLYQKLTNLLRFFQKYIYFNGLVYYIP